MSFSQFLGEVEANKETQRDKVELKMYKRKTERLKIELLAKEEECEDLRVELRISIDRENKLQKFMQQWILYCLTYRHC
jgi:hypothetical protein